MMPTYTFFCDECKVLREVMMPLAHFEEGGKIQVCSRCGKQMKQKYHSPNVIYKGPGFYKTDYKHKLPKKNVPEVEKELEHKYYEEMRHSDEFHEAKEATETVRINRFRNTKTGEKVYIPVDEK